MNIASWTFQSRYGATWNAVAVGATTILCSHHDTIMDNRDRTPNVGRATTFSYYDGGNCDCNPLPRDVVLVLVAVDSKFVSLECDLCNK